MAHVLIIEDDSMIAAIERDFLEANGFEVSVAMTGKEGLKIFDGGAIEAVLLDIGLPDTDGFLLCRKLRDISNVPILFITARGSDDDKIKGLGLGADDYIVKPFSPSELVARVIAHINRYERLTSTPQDNGDIIEIDNIKIDKKSRRVFVNGIEISFANKEFDLLTCLAENPNTVFSKDELFKKIWEYDSMGETSTVTVHVNRVRDKLFSVDKNFKYVNTVWGRGYRFNK